MRVDDASTVTLKGATLDSNGTADLELRFGSQATLEGNTIGSVVCDETVLVRGDSGCPEDDDEDDD